MTKTVFALVTAGILGAAAVPTGVYAFDAHATDLKANRTDIKQDKTDIRQDKTALRQDHRMMRHAVRTGNFEAAMKLRKNISMDRRDLRRDRIRRDELR